MTYKHLYFKNNSSDITDEHIDLLKDKVNSELTLSNDLFKYDFCNGFRIQFTDLTNQYYLTIMDNETKTVLFNGIIIPEEDTIYSFEKKYFIKYEIIIRKIQYNIIEPFPIFREVYNDKNKDILAAGTNKPQNLSDEEIEQGDYESELQEARAGNPCNLTSNQKGNGIGCAYYSIRNQCPYDSTKTYFECLP